MSNSKQIPVSVVINTADRAKFIGDTLRGLQQQTYDNFEVIVVNGPSEDNTEDVAKAFNIRYYTAPFNLSVSRNIGIKHAAGDIIAFIDDDAVPSPTWLEEIVQGYKSKDIGAVGGWVYHVDSADYQFKYGAISKWGLPVLKSTKDFDYNEPMSDFYNINIGTNATYWRKHLVDVGGFDEEIEYYHDESDVCVRLINHGHKVIELDGAIVHHKMAPSSRRKTWQNVTNWDSVVKNGVYFAVKHSAGVAPLYKRLIKPFLVHKEKYKLVFLAGMHRDLSPWQFIYRMFSLTRAFLRGYWRGFMQSPKLMQGYRYDARSFKKYKHASSKKLPYETIVIVSQGFPPLATDGVARYNHTLAKELAHTGHTVHVVTRSNGDYKKGIRYMDGFWVHYHDPQEHASQTTGIERLDNTVALTMSVYNTVKDISSEMKIDVILAPLWDVEGLALVRSKIAPVIVTLMSPLKKVVETQWSGVHDRGIPVMYELEKEYILASDGVMAISNAIKETISEDYGIDWASAGIPISTIPLGVEPSLLGEKRIQKEKNGRIDLLFVGRFEHRKGIDVLLETLPKLMEENEKLHVRLIGNALIPDIEGKFPYEEFKKKHKSKAWFSRIAQSGYVPDEQLQSAYAQCDIFVAPSRYESFGLIFVEALSNGKPVVGTDVGGIPEIIENGVNGLLVAVDDVEDLMSKLTVLTKSKKLRDEMGKAGVRLITEKFTAERMGKNFDRFVAEIIG
ncbi:glycosyltransferase [Candidatus Saccharibacteria bacterium]|nr:glycosyltransferase [Candidatus Saccharibacteria bacterium]